VDQLVWGLLPHDTEDPAKALRPITARAETVATNCARCWRSRA